VEETTMSDILTASQSDEEDYEDAIEMANDDYSPDEEYVLTEMTALEEHDLIEQSTYLQGLMSSTKLKILQPNAVKEAYSERGNKGLFNLFLNGRFFSNVLSWTNGELAKKGHATVSREAFDAYLGLELAMSLNQLNQISYYWSTKTFLGNVDFRETMSRDMFCCIRSCLKFHEDRTHANAFTDPLCHCRTMLNHFLKSANSVAVPTGCSALDENTIRCKARTKAKTYMPSKPIKFGICFYAVVGWKHAYLHSLWENRSENTTNETAAAAYCSTFPCMQQVFNQHMNRNLVDPASATALWCLQLAQLTRPSCTSDDKRVVFMDNFYTRHKFAKEVKLLSLNTVHVVGAMRINYVDAINKPRVKEAMELLKSKERGSWYLLQCFESASSITQSPEIATNTGYIVFKDRNIVIFYSNDLASTPTVPIQGSTDEAIACVHGLAPMKLWLGHEVQNCTTLQVPSVIVAYNIFMNSVDRFDQMRSTNITARREKQLTMSIFTFLLDASTHNAFALMKELQPNYKGSLMDFKQQLCESLTMPYRLSKKKKVPQALQLGTQIQLWMMRMGLLLMIFWKTRTKRRHHAIYAT
jgi:Transposase IS4